MRRLLTFVFPGAVLTGLAVAGAYADLPRDWDVGLRRVFPMAVLVSGLVLGWRFNRSRVLYALLVLALASQSLQYVGELGGRSVRATVIRDAIALLLPLNLLGIALFKERGILTLRGIHRLAMLGVQIAGLLLLYFYPTRHACGTVTRFLQALTRWEGVGLSHVALLLTSMAAIGMVLAFVRRRSAIESAFFWSILLGAAAAAGGAEPSVSSLYLSTGGLCLVLGVVEASYGMAFRDELTGLPGRRALKEACQRLGTDYAIAMVDVDHFKRVNDRYGHDVGDQVLRFIAARLQKVKGSGKAFRYGGEEFTVLFPGQDAAHAREHVDHVRREVAAWEFGLRGATRPLRKPSKPRPSRGKRRHIRVTFSAGIAARDARSETPDDVIAAADKALYKAKQAGRNRIC